MLFVTIVNLHFFCKVQLYLYSKKHRLAGVFSIKTIIKPFFVLLVFEQRKLLEIHVSMPLDA
jgi:hypothetical protein